MQSKSVTLEFFEQELRVAYEEFTGTVFSENSDIRKYVSESSHRIDDFKDILFELIIANAERAKQATLLSLKRKEMLVATSYVDEFERNLEACKERILSQARAAEELKKSASVLSVSQSNPRPVRQTVESSVLQPKYNDLQGLVV